MLNYDERIRRLEQRIQQLEGLREGPGIRIERGPGGIIISLRGAGDGSGGGSGEGAVLATEVDDVVVDVAYDTTTHELTQTKRQCRLIKRDLGAEADTVITTAVPLPET